MSRPSDTKGFRCTVPNCGGFMRLWRHSSNTHGTFASWTRRERVCTVCGASTATIETPIGPTQLGFRQGLNNVAANAETASNCD